MGEGLGRIRRLKEVRWALRRPGGGLLDAVAVLLPRIPSTDRLWSSLEYRRRFGRYPNLRSPGRLSEQLIRLKFSADGNSALRTRVTDKEFVKDYVREKLGPGWIPDTIAVLRSKAEAVRFDYPDGCVVKATHTSGDVIIRRDGSVPVDCEKVSAWFDTRYYERWREPNYRRLRPKVIVEERLREARARRAAGLQGLLFLRHPRVHPGRWRSILRAPARSLLAATWTPLDLLLDYPAHVMPLARPARLDAMLTASRAVSADFSFMRVDFYQLEGRILVGELTSFPEACFTRFTPDHADVVVGRLLQEPGLDVESLVGVRGRGTARGFTRPPG